MLAKHPLSLLGIVAIFAVTAVIAFTIVGCEKPAAPVQDQPIMIGDRPLPPLPKTTSAFLFHLNPDSDPSNGSCPLPYSSGGFNQPAVWVSHSYDLSAYAHRMVRIRFYFNTRDNRYNKFEGWYLDDITIGGTFNDVESGVGDWTVGGNQANPTWQITDHRSYSSSHSWYYGKTSDWTYRAVGTWYSDCNDNTNYGWLNSPVICLGSDPTLSFKTLWQIESVNPAYYDLMDILLDDLGPVPVPMDIHPAGCPNPLNVNAKGVLPVALCGTACLDFSLVDPTTIKLEGVSALRYDWEDVSRPNGHKPVDCADCNTDGPDGMMDLTLKFDIPALAAALGAVEDGECRMLTLTGKYLDGTSFSSIDYVKIIKKK